ADVRKHGLDSACLWGWKRPALKWICEAAEPIYSSVRALDDPETTVELVAELSTLPGLALVKGAFVAQMLGHDVACFDTRNLDALGYSAGSRPFREFRPNARWETRLRRAQA